MYLILGMISNICLTRLALTVFLKTGNSCDAILSKKIRLLVVGGQIEYFGLTDTSKRVYIYKAVLSDNLQEITLGYQLQSRCTHRNRIESFYSKHFEIG